ncbi:protein phosphatase 2C domain-containing protein [Exiguobacterium flavidum]|uniref:protein phosphatase 2C domain-containing protein n=1 Tax=Exiguobacterium flavidum TaxID=2184695 RepID=UPI000DF84F34|nr:protein phosphatase 2C domain-containing protein [Exiguobacterium flavidum]
MNETARQFSWVGSREHFVDAIDVQRLEHIAVGRYGGNSSAGQYKNEDGCLVWSDVRKDWEFAVLLDAHNTAESAEQVIELIERNESRIRTRLESPATQSTFKLLEEEMLRMFQSEDFLAACRNVTGETACLIAVRKENYLWWFSVGDCMLYLFHPELAALGQFQLNQRQFFEWVGQVNTFERNVPCYSTGVRELRTGENHILLTTDGLTECPNDPYSTPMDIADAFRGLTDEEGIQTMLKKIQANGVRDSTTIVSYKVTNPLEATRPSNA